MQLKTTLLATLAHDHRLRAYVSYDRDFDALMLLFVPLETEHIVHYLDDQVALLYQPETLEIVGLQIEDFERRFVPEHETVSGVWHLSEADLKLEDVGDMLLTLERKKPTVAREIVKAMESLLGQQGKELVKLLE
jgi:hypothetical protein